ncbi:MAG: hypothetical protein GF347_01835 [Candidatus Moranbacteria bacterium]|nr:hypothetical protein [Candidatus Moranbacteria bacterium]
MKLTKILKKKKSLTVLLFAIISAFLFDFSLTPPPCQADEYTTNINVKNPIGSDTFEETIISILDRLEVFIAGIALIMFIISGIVYIFSQGNQDRTALAKRIMTGSIIGLIIILGAKTILKEIYDIFGVVITGSTGASTAQSIKDVVQNVLEFVLSLIAMLAIISLSISGIGYMTSLGNQEAMEKNKKQIIYSIIGISIAIGSLVIIKQIASLIEG